MRTRPFGSTEVEVPVVGQGTWKIEDPARATAALERGLDLGLTHIDTAELYEGAEEILAPVLRERRDEIFLVSKVLPSNGSRDGVKRACERSLSKLGTDHLDAYLLHWPSDEHAIEETMGALAELVDEGKTRFLGVSNFEVAEIEEASRHTGRHRIQVNQVLYELGDRGMERELLPHCEQHDIAVVAYSPFGNGLFPPETPGGTETLERIASAYGVTPHQVALAFLLRHESVFTIPKSENPEHVERNAAAAELTLDAEHVEAIDRAFPLPDPGSLGVI